MGVWLNLCSVELEFILFCAEKQPTWLRESIRNDDEIREIK